VGFQHSAQSPGEVPVSAGEGTGQGMRPRNKAARIGHRQLRQLSKDLSTIPGFGKPPSPPPHPAKDFLGAVVTLAIIGAILLQVTDGLASHCSTKLNPRTGPGACSGMSAIAYHAHGAVILFVIGCALLAMIAFIWYMFWGYKINRQVGGNRNISGP
jgi:hypothetical protein